MRGVLVDQHDPVRGLGEDVGAVELGAGGAERRLRRIGAAGAAAGSVVLDRAAESVAGLGQRERRRGRWKRELPRACGETAAVRAQLARAKRGQRGGGDRGRGAMAGGGERVAQRADDQPAHQRGIAKADLGLGRMDIDVDLVGRAVEKQRDDRVAVARQHILIGAAHRADQQPVAHRPAVDDEILVARQSRG